MRYYGLHFTSDEKQPVQIRISTETLEVWARSYLSGGWTAWRRLDVEYNEDGTINANVAEATHAESADKLTSPMQISFGGDVSGSVSFDGSGDVTCDLSLSNSDSDSETTDDITTLKRRISDLELRVSQLEARLNYNNDGTPQDQNGGN